MNSDILSPPRAANQLSRILETYSIAHGLKRFPVDVKSLALECGELFGWDDPITEVKPADIKGFEGCLSAGEGSKKWLLLYNNALNSPGRIRFTQAHELGHYILHRQQREMFQCSDKDMLNWSDDDKDIEAQADRFASYLLMPLDDYRKQIISTVDLDMMGYCADRYGVSLTAAILKWLDSTNEKAVLVMSNDGFINWAWSSRPAFKAGAFFKTRNNVIAVPGGSLAANDAIKHDRRGSNVAATVWFKNADPDMSLCEMKLFSEQYDSLLTLLCLPRTAEVWPPREYDE